VKGNSPLSALVKQRVPALLLAWAWILSAATLFGATKLFLHDANSKLVPPSEFLYKLADSVQGTAKATAVTNSVGGAVTGQYWPSTSTGHIITKTAGGTKVIWFSRPLAAGVTLSGAITPNFWGLESAAQCNCGARYEVLRWSVAAGGITASLGISGDNGLSEWTTTAALRTTPTLTPTATAFLAGDRIVIVVYNDDASGTTEGNNRNWTLDYDGPTSGSDGDTYVSFTETFSFSPDTNNARSLPMTSELFNPMIRLKKIFERPPGVFFEEGGQLEALNIGGHHAK
jgi:hypothetical protein